MKLKKILLITIIILIILALCIVWALASIKNIDEEDKGLPNSDNYIELEKVKNLTQVSNRSEFYIAKRCIETFYTYYAEMFKDPLEGYLIKPAEGTVDVENIKNTRINNVYNLLDEEYLKYKEIDTHNITSKLSEIGQTSINIQNMYYVENENEISAYFVYGTKINTSNFQTEKFKIIVKADFKNRTYKILLDDYFDKYYSNLEIGQYIEIKEEQIKNDTINIFSYPIVSEEEYVNDLFTNYKNTLRTEKEYTYNLLDENYKKICFENTQEYLSYINERYSKIVSAMLDTYKSEKNGTYTEYLFKDTDGNYYIFRETAPFVYTVILDNYVLPTEDFNQQYNQSSNVKKVILNIKRFFMGIDDKNYGYSYSVISNGFKNNKYPSKNDFINYANQNFFEKNKIEYINYEEENGVYIYKIKITDSTGKSQEERNFNIIMKLNDETNFEMSFGN